MEITIEMSLSDAAKILLAHVRKVGNQALEPRIISPISAMPSASELDAEFGCQLIKHGGNVVVVAHGNDRAATRALDEHQFELGATNRGSFNHFEA